MNNIVFNNRQNGPRLYQLTNLPDPTVISGDHNWLSHGYDFSATELDPASTYRGKSHSEDSSCTIAAATLT